MRTPTWAEIIDQHIKNLIGEIRTCIPAQVQKYDAAKQLCDAKPMVKTVRADPDGNLLSTPDPVVPNIPVGFPRAGGYFISFPLKKGDFVWLMCADRSIDQWRARGVESEPGDIRHHDLSDALAIPMGFPTGLELTDTSASDLVIGKDGSGPLLVMKDDGSILIGRSAAAEAARKGDAIQAVIPAGTVVVSVSGGSGAPAVGTLNPADIVLDGEITEGSAKTKIE